MESARKVFTANMRRKETKLNEYFEKKKINLKINLTD